MQRVKTESEVLFVFAIVESGGKQYKVSEGDIIFVEKLNVNEGDTYTFEKVLAVSSPAGFSVGTPAVACTVTANVVKNGKGKKSTLSVINPRRTRRSISATDSRIPSCRS